MKLEHMEKICDECREEKAEWIHKDGSFGIGKQCYDYRPKIIQEAFIPFKNA